MNKDIKADWKINLSPGSTNNWKDIPPPSLFPEKGDYLIKY
jgi:hypothetical protein